MIEMKKLSEAIRAGERLGDGDAVIDLIEMTNDALFNLRSGAGRVQYNVTVLETRSKVELQKIIENVGRCQR